MSTIATEDHLVIYDKDGSNKMDIVRVPEGYSIQVDAPQGCIGYSSALITTGDISAMIRFLMGGGR
jgi:hypothetical protein